MTAIVSAKAVINPMAAAAMAWKRFLGDTDPVKRRLCDAGKQRNESDGEFSVPFR